MPHHRGAGRWFEPSRKRSSSTTFALPHHCGPGRGFDLLAAPLPWCGRWFEPSRGRVVRVERRQLTLLLGSRPSLVRAQPREALGTPLLLAAPLPWCGRWFEPSRGRVVMGRANSFALPHPCAPVLTLLSSTSQEAGLHPATYRFAARGVLNPGVANLGVPKPSDLSVCAPKQSIGQSFLGGALWHTDDHQKFQRHACYVRGGTTL